MVSTRLHCRADRLLVKCVFGTFLDNALRDSRIEAMKKNLMVEQGLTFTRAIEIAQRMESAAQKTKEFKGHSSAIANTIHRKRISLLFNVKR